MFLYREVNRINKSEKTEQTKRFGFSVGLRGLETLTFMKSRQDFSAILTILGRGFVGRLCATQTGIVKM